MEKQRIAKMLLKCEDEFRAILRILNMTEGDISFDIKEESFTVRVYERKTYECIFSTSFEITYEEDDNG
jgi:hypothetical protein